jgi:hypothetical protein
MGALKAGVTVVTFSEKENRDALHSVIADSGARGLIFSPQTKLDDNKGDRESILHKLMPELQSLYPGDELALKAYPDLKQIIQLGHQTIRGVIKFKDSMFYAVPSLSTSQLPDNLISDKAFDCYEGGRVVASYSSSDLVGLADSLWSDHFSHAGENPVFMSLDLESPLALASFLSNNANHQKVFIPATYNMSKILASLKI